MEDIVISQERIPDNVVFDRKHKYTVHTTVGLIKSGHFRVFFEFEVYDSTKLREIFDLYEPIKPLRISSDMITKEGYNISHIIPEQFITSKKNAIILACISDDPECSLL